MYSLRYFKNKEDYTNNKDSFLESTVSFVNDEEKTYFKLDPLTIVSFKVQLDYSKSLVASSGDTITPFVTYTQVMMDANGVSTTISGDSNSIDSSITISYVSDIEGFDSNSGIITVPSRGTELGDKITLGFVKAVVTINGVSASDTEIISQEENVILTTTSEGGETVWGDVDLPIMEDQYIPANGGTLSVSIPSAMQSYTVTDTVTTFKYSSQATSSITTTNNGGEVEVSPSKLIVKASAESKDITPSEITEVYTETVTWVGNDGKTASYDVTIYQEANKIAQTSYEGGVITYGAIEGVNYTEFTIPASGGSGVSVMNNATQPYSISEFKRVDTYSSNEKKYTLISAATTDVKVIVPNIVELYGEASSKGVVASDKTIVTSATVTWNGENNEVISKEVFVYQQENRVINESVTNGEIIYGDVIPGTITNMTIPASGGSVVSEATNGTQEWTTDASTVIYLYTSGEEEEVEMSDAKGGTNIVLPSVPYLTADAVSKGRIESEKTVVDEVLVEWIGNDNKKASDTMYVYQEANELVSTEYTNPMGIVVKVNDIPASGGSVNSGIESGNISQTVTYTYTSGIYSDEINPSYTITYNNVVSSVDLKDNLSERTMVGELEYTFTSNGKSTTSKVAVYQEANELEESYTEYEYGELVRGSVSNKVIAASGGTAIATATNGSQTYTATTHNIFTSGEYLSVNNGTSVIKPYPSSLEGTALSRGIVIGDEKEVISSRVTWSSMDNSEVLEDTLVITQEANVETIDDVTITYDDIVKGAVSVTPQVVSATGGTAIVTAEIGKQDFEEITTYVYTSNSSRTAVTNSGTLDVTPTISPSELTFGEIAATATTAPTKSSTVTWSLNGKTATSNVSATQELKRLVDSGTTYTYGDVTKGTITEATIDASGGTATTKIGNGKQPYTAVTWYEYHTGEVLEDAPKTGTNDVAPSQTTLVGEAESKKITVSDVTIVTEKDITWSGNDDKSATAVARVYQEANVRTLSNTEVLYNYGAIEKGDVNGISVIPARGGSVTITATTGSQAFTAYTAVTYSHTSNESLTTTEGEEADVQTLQPSISTWTVTADTRGTVTGRVRTVSSTTITWSGGGDKTDSTDVEIKQQENEITGTTGGNITYSEVTVGTLSVSNVIPAGGGSATVTATNGKQTITTSEVTVGYTSGAIEETTGERSQTVDVAPSASQTIVTADTRGTVTGNIKTVKTVTINYGGQGGKSNSASINVQQAKNAITATTYDTPSGLTLSVADIPAGGGTISEGIIGGTCKQKYTYSYDAGVNLSSTTETVTYSGNYTNSVSAATLGSTIKARTSVGTLKYSYTANGKSNTASATVYQALNKVTSVSGTGTPSISYPIILASGGTVSPSNSGFSARFYYSSGGYGDPSGYTSSRTYSGGSTNSTVLTLDTSTGNVSAPSRGTTSGASRSRTIKTTVTYSYTNPSSVGGGSVSVDITASCSCTQAENKKTARSEVAYNYADFTCGTISASPMTIPVGGGVSNISATNGSEKWSAITTYDYSSGDYSTAVTNTGTSTITPSISPSNGKLEFSDNSGNGSEVTKTATATWVGESDLCTNSVSVTQSSRTLTATTTGNTYGSYSYGDVVCGDIVLSQTSVGAGETVRVTASTTKGSQSWSRPYSAYTYYHYDDGTMDTVYSGKSTDYGSDDIVGSVNPSYYDFSDRGTVTGGTITKTFTGEWSGVGDSCTTEKSVSQEANTKAYKTSGVSYGITTYATPSCGTITLSKSSVGAGESVTVTATISNGTQSWTRTATPYSSYTYTSGDESTTNGTSYTDSGSDSIPCSVEPSTGFSFSDRCTTTGAAITKTFTGTCTANGKTCTTTKSVSQAANTRSYSTSGVSYGSRSYGAVTAGTITNATVHASGGTKTATAGNATQSWTRTATPYSSYTYTSGCESTTNGTSYTDSGTSSITPDYSSTSATGSHLGTTYKCETTLASRKVTWSGGGSKSATRTMYVKQEANVITSLDAIASSSYSTHISYSPTTLAAGGGTATCNKHGSSQLTFTSGSKTTHGNSGNYYGGTFTWSRTYKVSGSGFSIDTSNGNVTAASRGTTIGSARTGTVTSVMTVSYTPTGGCGFATSDTMTSTATITQALNKVEYVTGTSTPSITYATIPAGGGTVSPSNSGFNARFYYSSGSYGDPSGYSAVRTYSAGAGSTVLTLNTSTGAVSGPDRMATTGVAWSREIQTTVTYSYTNPSSVGGGSVSTSITATGTVTQQANTILYSGGEWLNLDAYNKLTSCRDYTVGSTYRTYTSGTEETVNPSEYQWSCDGDITGSGSGTSGNFCPSSPYGGSGSGHIKVTIDDEAYIVATATLTVEG